MIYVLYGALGVIGVIVLLGVGILCGWKGHIAWQAHTRKAVSEEASEEERRQLQAQQKAFEGMLNYNTEMAYGCTGGITDE